MSKGRRNRSLKALSPEQLAEEARRMAAAGNHGGWLHLPRWNHCCLCQISLSLVPIQPDYIVNDSVWDGEAGLAIDAGVAHPTCLEAHIGRELVGADFKDIPFNDPIRLVLARRARNKARQQAIGGR